MSEVRPRLVVAGAAGDSGKTLVSLGAAAAWRNAGFTVSAFKKGPDYIDAAWLSRAAGRPARNLDAWIMGDRRCRDSFLRRSADADVSVVEGNRGLLDGWEGHSTAALARALDAPVLLVLDVTKVTRTAAAIVAGCRTLEPGLRLAGVVANRIGGSRHAREVRRAIEETTGVPVLGAIPRLGGHTPLPDRHLGLVPPEEHGRMEEVVDRLAGALGEHVDLGALLDLARSAPAMEGRADPVPPPPRPGVRIGVFRDSAFTFYYPENLEALEAHGAEVVPVSALEDPGLPDVDLLYLGGGFPETHAAALAGNRPMLESVRRAASRGLPVYAECGGLIYLARSVRFEGRRAELSGVLDVDVEVAAKPQGHGYAEMVVREENPFFAPGTVLRGHEFHYSRIEAPDAPRFAFDVRKGVGSMDRRDGIVAGNVLASWLHLHALGCPDWAPALVERARRYAESRDRTGTETRYRSTCGSGAR